MNNAIDARLEQTATWLREYGMTDNNRAWVMMFETLTESIKQALLYASIETVPQLQAQARQLQALHDIVTSKIPTNGRA